MSEFFHRLPEFVGNHLALSALFVALVIALIVTEVLQLAHKYKKLAPGDLTLLINREDALVLDLSSYNDYEKGHVPGARHMAVSQFEPDNKDLLKARDEHVVLVCKDGRASAKAAQKLIKAGYEKVAILAGGMLAWRQADLPVDTGRH